MERCDCTFEAHRICIFAKKRRPNIVYKIAKFPVRLQKMVHARARFVSVFFGETLDSSEVQIRPPSKDGQTEDNSAVDSSKASATRQQPTQRGDVVEVESIISFLPTVDILLPRGHSSSVSVLSV